MSAGVSHICGGTFQDPSDYLKPWTVPPLFCCTFSFSLTGSTLGLLVGGSDSPASRLLHFGAIIH